jgi:glycosyltransferase involved in cell wall biosynthesis
LNVFRAAARLVARQVWIVRNRRAFVDPRGGGRKHRLLVDVSMILHHDARTGIQRTVRAIWSELLRRDGEAFEILPVAASRTHGYRFGPRDFLLSPPSKRRLGPPVGARPGDVFLGLDLSAHLLPLYESQVASWRSAGATVHVVVYDLLPVKGPGWFNPSTVNNFTAWFELLKRHCDEALCISDDVARDLRRALGVEVARPTIARVELAGDLGASLPSKGITLPCAKVIAHASSRAAILMVGTVEPRKGYDLALAAFEHLWSKHPDETPDLVIVGQPGWRTEALQERLRNHPEMNRRLFWLASASDEALSALYKACLGLFLSSHAEGFGLPVAEAAAHGRRALVRDLAVFREQRLANVTYFSDDRPVQLGRAILAFAHERGEVATERNLVTWSQCADRLFGHLLDAASGAVEEPCTPQAATLVC